MNVIQVTCMRNSIDWYIEESCGRVAIRNTTFENLKNSPIKSLVLRGCAYKTIESGSFAMLKHLKNLNLACATHLSIKDVLVAINEMPRATLDTLILDGMKMQTNTSFCNENLRNLRRLSMRDTGISSIEMKIENKCLESLEHLNIAGNYPAETSTYYSTLPAALFVFGFVFQWPFNGLWSGKPIPVVDASNMLAPPDYVTNNFCKSEEQQFDEYFQSSHVKYVNPPFPDNSNDYGDTPFSYVISPLRLNVLYQSNNFATGFWNSETLQQINQAGRCSGVFLNYSNEVVYFNFTNNNLQTLPCPFMGMGELKVFDCSSCKLNYIHRDFFIQKYLPKLEFLHLKQNNLGQIASLFPDLFRDSNKLKEIILARNNIKTLPENSFEQLEAVEILDLSENAIENITFKISHLRNLWKLDLRNNKILSTLW